VKHLRGKGVRIVRVPGSPSAFDRLQFLQARGEDFAQLLEILKCLAEIAQFVHQIDLGKKSDALVAKFRALLEPLAQDAMPRRGRLIYPAARPALGGRLAAAKQSLLLQALQRRIDLAEFGGPKVMDTFVENRLQVVAARRLAKQSEQDRIQTHEPDYITVCINVNCLCQQAFPGRERPPMPLPLRRAGFRKNLCDPVQVE
jgi:hypothetical protein